VELIEAHNGTSPKNPSNSVIASMVSPFK